MATALMAALMAVAFAIFAPMRRSLEASGGLDRLGQVHRGLRRLHDRLAEATAVLAPPPDHRSAAVTGGPPPPASALIFRDRVGAVWAMLADQHQRLTLSEWQADRGGGWGPTIRLLDEPASCTVRRPTPDLIEVTVTVDDPPRTPISVTAGWRPANLCP